MKKSIFLKFAVVLALFTLNMSSTFAEDPKTVLPKSLISNKGQLLINGELLKGKILMIESVPNLTYLILRDGKWKMFTRNHFDSDFESRDIAPEGVEERLINASFVNSKAEVFLASKGDQSATKNFEYISSSLDSLDTFMADRSNFADFNPDLIKWAYGDNHSSFDITPKIRWNDRPVIQIYRLSGLAMRAAYPTAFLTSATYALNESHRLLQIPELDHHTGLAWTAATLGVWGAGQGFRLLGKKAREILLASNPPSRDDPVTLAAADSFADKKPFVYGAAAILGAPLGLKVCELAIKGIGALHGHLYNF